MNAARAQPFRHAQVHRAVSGPLEVLGVDEHRLLELGGALERAAQRAVLVRRAAKSCDPALVHYGMRHDSVLRSELALGLHDRHDVVVGAHLGG